MVGAPLYAPGAGFEMGIGAVIATGDRGASTMANK